MSNKKLIEHLKNTGVLKSVRIEEALRTVDRRHFVPKQYEHESYGDYPLPIGGGQTISQPYTVVFMLELLDVQKGDKVLDVGSGSGWSTALLAYLVGKEGSVIGVERVPELVVYGKQNLAKFNFTNAHITQAGEELGEPAEAPFDRILASAAASEIPEALVKQLKIGGRLVIPVHNAIVQVDRTAEGQAEKRYEGFEFVPLIE